MFIELPVVVETFLEDEPKDRVLRTFFRIEDICEVGEHLILPDTRSYMVLDKRVFEECDETLGRTVALPLDTVMGLIFVAEIEGARD